MTKVTEWYGQSCVVQFELGKPHHLTFTYDRFNWRQNNVKNMMLASPLDEYLQCSICECNIHPNACEEDAPILCLGCEEDYEALKAKKRAARLEAKNAPSAVITVSFCPVLECRAKVNRSEGTCMKCFNDFDVKDVLVVPFDDVSFCACKYPLAPDAKMCVSCSVKVVGVEELLSGLALNK